MVRLQLAVTCFLLTAANARTSYKIVDQMSIQQNISFTSQKPRGFYTGYKTEIKSFDTPISKEELLADGGRASEWHAPSGLECEPSGTETMAWIWPPNTKLGLSAGSEGAWAFTNSEGKVKSWATILPDYANGGCIHADGLSVNVTCVDCGKRSNFHSEEALRKVLTLLNSDAHWQHYGNNDDADYKDVSGSDWTYVPPQETDELPEFAHGGWVYKQGASYVFEGLAKNNFMQLTRTVTAESNEPCKEVLELRKTDKESLGGCCTGGSSQFYMSHDSTPWLLQAFDDYHCISENKNHPDRVCVEVEPPRSWWQTDGRTSLHPEEGPWSAAKFMLVHRDAYEFTWMPPLNDAKHDAGDHHCEHGAIAFRALGANHGHYYPVSSLAADANKAAVQKSFATKISLGAACFVIAMHNLF